MINAILTGYRVTWEMGLGIRLWAIVLIALIELGSFAHSRWHPSLPGIQKYVRRERGCTEADIHPTQLSSCESDVSSCFSHCYHTCPPAQTVL